MWAIVLSINCYAPMILRVRQLILSNESKEAFRWKLKRFLFESARPDQYLGLFTHLTLHDLSPITQDTAQW